MISTSSDVSTLFELYSRWERQHWTVEGINLEADRVDWLNLTDQQRLQWYWLASFSHYRKTEADAVILFATLLPCLHRPEQQFALGVQIADESRHALFFERFHNEVLSADATTSRSRSLTGSPAYQYLFTESANSVVRRAVGEPSRANLAAAIFHLFIVLEGAVALASFSVIRQLLTKTKRFPGLLAGFRHAHRDEVRHVRLGMALLQDCFVQEPQSRNAVTTHLKKVLPSFSQVLQPQPERKAILESLGMNPFERRQRAFNLLQRHLRILGIGADLVEPWTAAPFPAEICN